MPTRNGFRLFVNCGPSEARRRLKGFGHGVRKVQSAGRNQAEIIHTAAGRWLTELVALFADVGYATREGDLSEPVDNLRNLGPTSAEWLREVGVTTIADLKRLGPAMAYRLVKEQHPQASLNLLWSLAAGLENRDWRELSEEDKEKLRREAEEP